jgi:hypothetical protein
VEMEMVERVERVEGVEREGEGGVDEIVKSG